MTQESKKQPTILIVEDELALLTAYAEELIEEGFIVLKAANGQEGLDTALAQQPDLILLDILMPVMDGLTMLQRLRQKNSWGKSVPVIMLTNLLADEEKIIRSIALYEPAYYLIKSHWSLQDVVEKIRERLDRKKELGSEK